MTPSARLQAVIDLLDELAAAARPADAVTSAFFRARRQIEDRDRGEILAAIYALLRHHARLGWRLARLGRRDTARNRVLVWLSLVEGCAPDQVERLCSGARLAPDALSDHEFELLLDLRGEALLHPDMPDAVRLECPSWALAPLQRRFGDRFEAEMEAALTPPPLDLRVNPIRTDRGAVLRELRRLGIDGAPTPLAPHGVRAAERFSLARLKGLKTGEVEIQDEGSQLVAQLVDARPGERIVDFCAGAGGKSLALAAQMQGRGRLIACDVNEGRLKRCAERLRRAGLHNAETRLLTSETDRWVKRRKGTCDRVLVDAPCSGTGTWRRNPDARWRETDAEGLEALAALQGRILASAARLVKPGGRLVYATCSLLPEENEAQVHAFLAAHPAFRLMPLAEAAPEIARNVAGEVLALTPAAHDTDGFFAAVLTREQAPEAAA